MRSLHNMKQVVLMIKTCIKKRTAHFLRTKERGRENVRSVEYDIFFLIFILTTEEDKNDVYDDQDLISI
jgi:hypothetical protein